MKTLKNISIGFLISLLGFVSPVFAQHSEHAQHVQSEAQFIEMMSKHHQDGIEMAKMAQQKSENKEVKKMSQKIINDQSKDIAKLQTWKKKWHANESANAEMPKMDMSKLQGSNGKEFDQAFVEMMAKHHEDGVAMAKAAMPNLTHKEVKDFASKSVQKQTTEISKLEKMKTSLQ